MTVYPFLTTETRYSCSVRVSFLPFSNLFLSQSYSLVLCEMLSFAPITSSSCFSLIYNCSACFNLSNLDIFIPKKLYCSCKICFYQIIFLLEKHIFYQLFQDFGNILKVDLVEREYFLSFWHTNFYFCIQHKNF